MFILKKTIISKNIKTLIFTLFFTVLFLISSSQLFSSTIKYDNEFYKSKWEEISKFDSKRLPKSSLKVIKSIYNKAKDENNSEQILKSLFHKYNNSAKIDEDATVLITNNLQIEIKYFTEKKNIIVKSALHSILASTYFSYYKNNMYKILERTELTSKEKNKDIKVWSAKEFIEECVYHFDKSLEDKEILKKRKIRDLKEILQLGNSDKEIRPSIYDFLIHRAINFYSNETASLTRAKDIFDMDDVDFFSDLDTFLKIELESNGDVLSFDYKTLKLYQDLLKYNYTSDHKYPSLLFLNDLNRLSFVYTKTNVVKKDTIFEKKLISMIDRNKSFDDVSEVYYKLAEFYNHRAFNGREIKNIKIRDLESDKRKAVEICEMVIKKYPKSYGATKCRNLLYSIDTKNLSIQIAHVNPIEKPILGLLKHKNISKTYFKIIKTNFVELDSIRNTRNGRNKLVNFYLKKESIKEWELNIKNELDYMEHSFEFKIPSLKKGLYILLASTNSSFDKKNGIVSTSEMIISNIAFISNDQENKEGIEYYFFDRVTGKKLTDISASIWIKERRNKKNGKKFRSFVKIENNNFHTNKNGNLIIPKDYVKNKNIYLELKNNKNDDTFFTSKSSFRYNNRNHRNKKITKKSYFFTDRAIYRPGQVAHFKAITLEIDNKDTDKNKPIENFERKIDFYDANHQIVSSVNLKTNDFGSVSGSFQIPPNMLNGRFVIKDSYGKINISVEEYKRPKFYAKFQDLSEDYKLNDLVKVTGKADSYAGFAIDNAKVTYKVSREVYYPYFWCFRYYHYPYFNTNKSKIITTGETITNQKGEFIVNFVAKPDLSANKKFQPAFLYKISADITDITGETKTITKNIKLGYTSLIITNDLSDIIDISNKSDLEFTIDSNNLDNEFITSKGKIKVFKLNDNRSEILRKRLWDKPDRFLLDEDDFKDAFPNDIYKDEDELVNFEKDKLCVEMDFDTSKRKEYKIEKQNFDGIGYYLVEIIGLDKSGKEVKDLKYITVFDKKDNEIPYKTSNWFYIDEKKIYQPGDILDIIVGSSLDNTNLLLEVKNGNEIIKKELLLLSEDEQQIIKIPIIEKYRGGISVSVISVGLNRVFSETKEIKIQWLNKKLKYSIEHFRDKLKPGKKEEWKIKISGYKDEKVFSELLLTMYDASLDFFKKHSFENNGFKYIFKDKKSYSNWKYRYYFDKTRENSSGKYNNHDYPKNGIFRIFSRFKNLNFLNSNYGRGGGYKNGGGELSLRGGRARETAYMIDGVSLNSAPMKSGAMSNKVGNSHIITDLNSRENTTELTPRKNFNETAFFYPNLTTDENGETTVSFTVPESLTKWNILGFAHTKELEHIFFEKELITQKQLMVIPNFPRFFRRGDNVSLNVKIKNLSEIDWN